MPELPEVEVVRQGLEAVLPGRTVSVADVRAARVHHYELETLSPRLAGQRVVSVGRRGKFLLLRFDRDTLLIHLGMTGQLTFWDKTAQDSVFIRHPKTGLEVSRQHAPDKHTHLRLWFDDGNGLHYRDVRKFGRLEILANDEVTRATSLARLGPEPLGPHFTQPVLTNKLARSRRAIKAVLLDQHVVAGLGNIYVDEALFVARVHPRQPANTVSRAASKRLHRAIVSVLETGIAFRGTSFRDYVNSDGERGSNQEHLFAYGRKGAPCRTCGTAIEKTVVAQRGTHFCPRCQRVRRGSK